MHRSNFRGAGKQISNGPVQHLSKSISESIVEPYHNLSQAIKQIDSDLTKVLLLISNVRNDIAGVKSGSVESNKAVSAAHISVMKLEHRLTAAIEGLSAAVSAIKIPSNDALEGKISMLEKAISKAQRAMDKAKTKSDVSAGGNETMAKAMSSIMSKLDKLSTNDNGNVSALETRLESISTLLSRPREVVRKNGVITGWKLN